ncbi:hypothetical protein FOA52_015782 [Chlamydomonas sp. UWO 241]|nr:hypothetical protein FOA52_015782 [Chlamydomonas sp. UWO 241]
MASMQGGVPRGGCGPCTASCSGRVSASWRTAHHHHTRGGAAGRGSGSSPAHGTHAARRVAHACRAAQQQQGRPSPGQRRVWDNVDGGGGEASSGGGGSGGSGGRASAVMMPGPVPGAVGDGGGGGDAVGADTGAGAHTGTKEWVDTGAGAGASSLLGADDGTALEGEYADGASAGGDDAAGNGGGWTEAGPTDDWDTASSVSMEWGDGEWGANPDGEQQPAWATQSAFFGGGAGGGALGEGAGRGVLLGVGPGGERVRAALKNGPQPLADPVRAPRAPRRRRRAAAAVENGEGGAAGDADGAGESDAGSEGAGDADGEADGGGEWEEEGEERGGDGGGGDESEDLDEEGFPPVPADITALSRQDYEALLPLRPTRAQKRFYEPGSLPERIIELLGSLGASILLSKAALLAAPALLYPLWASWLRAGLRNLELYSKQFACVGLWRSTLIECEVLGWAGPAWGPAGGGRSAASVRLVVGDEVPGGARVALEFPYQPRAELLVPGEPCELLVLCRDDDFLEFKAVREIYLPASGLWLTDYPFVDRAVFLDVSLDIEAARQAEAAAEEAEAGSGGEEAETGGQWGASAGARVRTGVWENLDEGGGEDDGAGEGAGGGAGWR